MKFAIVVAGLMTILATNSLAQPEARYDPPLVQSELDYLDASSRRVDLDIKELQPGKLLELIGSKAKLEIEVRGSLPDEPVLTKSFRNATVKQILVWYASEVPVLFKARSPDKLVVLVNTETEARERPEAG